MTSTQALTPQQFFNPSDPANPNQNGNAPDPKLEPTDNLPFDPRISRTSYQGLLANTHAPGYSDTTTVQTGSIQTLGSPRFTCFFLFNPNEVDKSYAFDPSATGALPAMYQPSATQGELQGLALNQTFSFNLLFDRTYEAWQGPLPSQNQTKWGPGPYQWGAQWDVWAVERLVGIYGQAYGGTPSGPPVASQVRVNLANSKNPQSLARNTRGGSSLTFTGWLSSISVQYTRFDASMVPTRASVALSFLQIYANGQPSPVLPAQTATAGASTGNILGSAAPPVADTTPRGFSNPLAAGVLPANLGAGSTGNILGGPVS